MHDFTVGTASTPTPGAPPAPGRIAYHKGEPIEFSEEQITRLFWVKVNRAAPGGCWDWTGRTLPHGYGQIFIAKKNLYSHRVSFEVHKGQIPDGLHIDHLCRNRACCNPDHLEAVTCGENIRRSPIAPATLNAAKTHCDYGHEFADANTMLVAGGRACRTCHRWRGRVASAKKAGLPYEPSPPVETVTIVRKDMPPVTSCVQGHPYDAANTYVDPRGVRKCRACAAEHRRRYNAKRSAVSK